MREGSKRRRKIRGVEVVHVSVEEQGQVKNKRGRETLGLAIIHLWNLNSNFQPNIFCPKINIFNYCLLLVQLKTPLHREILNQIS